jgi:HEAT repeat protein/tetratricopeptide (TPR) repeat protein
VAIQITCVGCQAILNAPETALGKKLRCPKCKMVTPVQRMALNPDDQGNSKAPSIGAVRKEKGTGIRQRCPKCHVLLSLPASAGGKKVRCSKCSEIFTISAPKLISDAVEQKQKVQTPSDGPHRRKRVGLLVAVLVGVVCLCGGTFLALQLFGYSEKTKDPIALRATDKGKKKPPVTVEPKSQEAPIPQDVPESKPVPMSSEAPVAIAQAPVSEPKVPEVQVVESQLPNKEDLKKTPEPALVNSPPKQQAQVSVANTLPVEMVEQLRKALADQDFRVRERALQALEKEGSKAEVLFPEVYKIMVDDDNGLTRRIAMGVIGQLGHLADAAVPGLIEMIEDEGEVPLIKAQALQTLGKIGRAGLPYLQTSLKNKEPLAREQAVRIIAGSRLEVAERLDIIIPMLRDPNLGVQLETIKSLRGIGLAEKNVVPTLGGLLADKNPSIRLTVTDALIASGPLAVAVLPEILEGLEKLEGRTFLNLLQVLERMGPERNKAMPTLLKLVKTGPEDRAAAVAAVIVLMDPGNEEMIPILIKSISQRFGPGAYQSVIALGHCGPAAKEAIPLLIKGMRTSQEPFASATFLSLKLMGADAIPAVRAELKSLDKVVQRKAAMLLSYFGQQAAEAIPELRAALKDQDKALCGRSLMALESMGRLARPACREMLPFLRDPDHQIRYQAAKTLAWVGLDEAAVPEVLAMIKDASIPERWNSVLALAGAGKAGSDALTALIKDKDGNIKMKAEEALAIHKKHAAVEARLADLQSPDAEVRFKAAADILRADPRERQAILEIVAALNQADPNKRLRAMADLKTMGEFNHNTELIPPLVKALRDPRADVRQEALLALQKINKSVGGYYAQVAPTPTKNAFVFDPPLSRTPLYAQVPTRTRQTGGPPELPIQCPVRLLVAKDNAALPSVAVFDLVKEPGPIRPKTPRSILARELIRQALVITLREELGIAVRDLSLQETFPPDPKYVVKSELLLTCFFPAGKKAEVALATRSGEKPEVLWKKDIPLYANGVMDYLGLTIELELLSRQQWPKVLEQAGFGKPRPGKMSAVTKQDGPIDNLDSLSFFAQFAALRDRHTAIHDKGESPGLLGDLVRGYANLGLLAEFHWNANHKIYKARALLYAQRLLAREPQSSWGLWHRAYAAALTGREDSAIADLAAADKLARDAVAKDAAPRPAWVDMVDAYGRGQMLRLKVLAKSQPLAGLLQFRRIAEGGSSTRILEYATDFLKENPECFSAWDVLSALPDLGILHSATTAGPALLTENIAKRLQACPDLPDSVANLLQGKLKDPAQEKKALDSMVAASLLGKDENSLTWSSLAGTVRNTRFVQVMRRLEFMRNRWSVPTEQYFQEIEPWIIDHPIYLYLKLFARVDQAKNQEMMIALNVAVDWSVQDFTPTIRLMGYLDRVEKDRGKNLIRAHQDDTSRDLNTTINWSLGENRARWIQQLCRVSPHSVRGPVWMINEDWDNAQLNADAWERTDNPDILAALARRYASMKDKRNEAERCLLKTIELAPDTWAFNALAGIYKERKQDDKWLATMEAFLKLPSLGLDHARAQVTIANHYKNKGELEKAVKYAEEAAQSGASFALQTASICNEAVKNFEKAEMYMRAISERYPEEGDKWFLWCQRWRKGDLKTAAELAEKSMVQRGINSEQVLWIKSLNALWDRKWQAALNAYQGLLQRTKGSQHLLFIALIAEEMKNTELRDASLKQIPGNLKEAKLAGFFQEAWKEKKPKLNLPAIDQILAAEAPDFRSNGNYLVGWFLEMQGQKDQAMVYYERCANGQSLRPYVRTLAFVRMKENGQENATEKTQPK